MGKLTAWGEWFLTPGRVTSCEDCPWLGDEEQCGKCKKPNALHIDNVIAWEAWQVLSKFGRDGMSGMLKISEVLAYVAAVEATKDDFMKILKLEDIFQDLKEKS